MTESKTYTLDAGLGLSSEIFPIADIDKRENRLFYADPLGLDQLNEIKRVQQRATFLVMRMGRLQDRLATATDAEFDAVIAELEEAQAKLDAVERQSAELIATALTKRDVMGEPVTVEWATRNIPGTRVRDLMVVLTTGKAAAAKNA